MKKTLPYLLAFCLILTVFAFVSCGDGEMSDQNTLSSEGEVPSAPESTPEPTAEPATEEELRKAVGTLGDEGEELALKGKYYERLYAMDLFGEEDYLALAQIYGAQGDWESQRLMLSKALRLYPCQEYADMVSGIVVKKDGGDEAASALAAQVTAALEQQDVQALKGLMGTQEWRQEMLGELAGIMNRIQYRTETDLIQVATDGISAEIVWRDGAGKLFFFRTDAAETAMGTALLGEEGYQGLAEVSYYDKDGNALQTYKGSLKGEICVGELSVSYQGTEYVGRFDEDGKTLEEQVKDVTADGGVCYAYASGGRNYLYQGNTTVEDFRIDTAYLGLPEYAEWR